MHNIYAIVKGWSSPRSILVFSGRYHIISNASLVNNCIISYYYKKMSKLQFCTESNYAAIFQLNLLPGKILFLSFRLGNFFWKLGKKEDILDWEWGLYSAPGDREKGPCRLTHQLIVRKKLYLRFSVLK